MKKINWKFQIPWKELCPTCREILKQRKKEQTRVNNRQFMAMARIENKVRSD